MNPLCTVVLSLLVLAAACGAPALAAPPGHSPNQPVAVWRDDFAGRPIRDRYIVLFKSSVVDPEAESVDTVYRAGGSLHFTYGHAVRGFAATLPPGAVRALRRNPRIALVEQDQTVAAAATQGGATWGLDRIDQRKLPLSGSYRYNLTGSGVFAFVIDTGIRSSHSEFVSPNRVLPGYGFTSISDGRGTEDCNGHGTHVAGTLAGKRWGVAKQALLVPVRVLDCRGSGALSGVLAGLDFVTAQRSLRPAVANLSFNTATSTALDRAVARAVDAGVTVVVAAGNKSTDACNSSPARQPTAITVAATTSADRRASFSNYGPCVDVFAPGAGVTSAWHSGNTATRTMSGTSMATPHVAGVAALLLESNAAATPAAIASAISRNATANRITDARTGTPNRLVFSLGPL